MKKVLIVGGGPAGASAGIHLLRNKYDVFLFERGDRDRSKTCGEGLTPESQHVLQKLWMLKKVQSLAYKAHGLTLFDLFNKSISVNNTYLTLKRSRFDRLLRDEVEALGGNVFYNTTITDINIEKDSVIIRDQNKKKYEGDLIILATGAETTLAKKMGFTLPGSYAGVSMRAYAENSINCKTLEFYFHEKLFPAYGWIFPLPDNLLNIGVYTDKNRGPTRDLSRLMSLFYEVLSERFDKPLRIVEGPKGWILNTGLSTDNLCQERVLLCGENIACTYNFSGEGIGPALKSGFLAAETILQAKGDFSKERLMIYEQKIKTDLGPMHEGYNTLAKLFQSKIIFFIACLLLRYSRNVKQTVRSVIDEKISLKEALSLKHIFRF